MTTWEEIFQGYVGIANKFLCATCLNQIFRGSSGHFGQKLILNKIAPPGALHDENNHAITFQCQDCMNKEPIVFPIIHPSGEIVNHMNISELADAQDKQDITRAAGDYDNREEMAKINKQYQPDYKPTPKEEEETDVLPSVYDDQESEEETDEAR